jgi:hypothetical protein
MEKRMEESMKYLELIREQNELVEERLALVTERLRELEQAPEIEAPFSDYFKNAASYLLTQAKIEQAAESGALFSGLPRPGNRETRRCMRRLRREHTSTPLQIPPTRWRC